MITFMEVCGANLADFVHSCAWEDFVELWHHQLGHLNVKSIYALQSIVKGINLGKTYCAIILLVCTEDKQYVAKWANNEEMLAARPLEFVHSNVCSPMRTTLVGRTWYFVTFVNNILRGYGFIQ